MVFQATVPAKCLLSGGYNLSKNILSIVSPLKNFQFELKYTPADIKTSRTICGDGFRSTDVILWAVVHEALKVCGKNSAQLTGYFDINNSIPAMSGLGFSAAMSVAVAKWAYYLQLINQYEIFDLALTLEEIFHKDTNEVDIVGVMSSGLTVCSSGRQTSNILPTWSPDLYISNSEDYQFTSKVIEHLKILKLMDPDKFTNTLEKMKEASLLMIESLTSTLEEREELFTTALKKSNECYYDWGIVSEKLDNHVKEISKYATSCKIIGPGFGGFVLSYWKEEPPEKLPFTLEPVRID